jgi:RNA polymerase sigma-70 factor (ECF subfamily)
VFVDRPKSDAFQTASNPFRALCRLLGRSMTKWGTNSSADQAAGAEGSVRAPTDLLRVFNELRDELVSTLWFMLGNREDAQDAAQEAFLKCWRAQDQLAEIRDLRAWVFRIGLNAARDLQRSAWHRRSKQFSGEDALLAGSDKGPEQNAVQQETLERLRHAILQLRQEEKEVFLLRQNGDLTFEQIAEIRKAPLGTVKTQMRSALFKLRRIMA